MVRRGLFSITSTVGPGRGYISIIIIVAAAAAAFIVSGCEAAADDQKYYPCNTSTCGNLGNISYPFRLTDNPSNCGDHRYNLSCEKNRTVLYLYSGRYYVESISYENRTMIVVDSGLHIHNCSSLPLNSLTFESNFSSNDPYSDLWTWGSFSLNYLVFITCETPITFTSTPTFQLFVNTSPCINASSGSHSYVTLAGDGMQYSDVPDSCTVGKIFPIRYRYHDNTSFSEIHQRLFMGFELSWYRIDCGSCNKDKRVCYPVYNGTHNYVTAGCDSSLCTTNFFRSLLRHPLHCTAYYLPGFFDSSLPSFFKKQGKSLWKGIMIARTSVGILCLCTMLIYMLRRRHLSMDANIEEFLQEHNNLMLLQYSYSDIKKMTKHFRDKLGQGGFGSVYKGKLRSGNLVAIKMLAESKGNGQDFINEVATIGRIHHVNVVQLIGFCFQGSKRALVYDFMPNGSLDKYIFTQEQTGISLSWESMHKIALGIAHGIDYLHQGCDMQILHFDIKPHNVLLDDDFAPKISDFGLAKLYPTTDNTIPLTAARGTIGYIAPELVYKSMGGVSYKADVYSFGMLLMEMAGRRKNVNPFANSTSSQIYFPSWIYDKLHQGEDMEIEDATQEEKQIVRKMVIVALSCIQLKPVDRPSMSRVIEMLESPTELLQMPPRPFLGSSFERVEEDRTIIEPSTTSLHSSSSSNYSLEIESN